MFEKRIFKIPVGNLSREEAEERIRELMKKFNYNPAYFVRKDREKKLKRIFKNEIC